MELIVAVAVGIFAGSGVWLVLRPRTFQVIMGLALLSYAVNLFIFAMGSLSIDDEPIIAPGLPQNLEHYSDPLPQALVLTAIVIGFAITALFLVVLMAARGMFGNDHVDGIDDERGGEAPADGGEVPSSAAPSSAYRGAPADQGAPAGTLPGPSPGASPGPSRRVGSEAA
jgi:multicomponent K+:H+ antiporter subunit C